MKQTWNLVAPQSAGHNRTFQEFQGHAMFTCNQINTRNDQTYQMYMYVYNLTQ